jgi:hypothetical protein
MATAGAAMDLVNKGVETITKVLRPRTSEIKVVEGGFAKCLPDGVSDSDLDAGDIRIFRAVSSTYHGERAKEMLGDVLGGALGPAWDWELAFSWKAHVRDHGTGAFILDASFDVHTTESSDQIAWEWKAVFPGKGRWHDREKRIVELPFKLTVKAVHTPVYDSLRFENVYRGCLRGNGDAMCLAV